MLTVWKVCLFLSLSVGGRHLSCQKCSAFTFALCFPFSDFILLSFLSVFPLLRVGLPCSSPSFARHGELFLPCFGICGTFLSFSRLPFPNNNELRTPLAFTSISCAVFSGPPQSCELYLTSNFCEFSLCLMPIMLGVVPDGTPGASEALRRTRAALPVPLRSAH